MNIQKQQDWRTWSSSQWELILPCHFHNILIARSFRHVLIWVSHNMPSSTPSSTPPPRHVLLTAILTNHEETSQSKGGMLTWTADDSWLSWRHVSFHVLYILDAIETRSKPFKTHDIVVSYLGMAWAISPGVSCLECNLPTTQTGETSKAGKKHWTPTLSYTEEKREKNKEATHEHKLSQNP